MEQYVYWVVTTIIALMIGALGWFMKRMISDLEAKISRSEAATQERLKQLERRIDKQDERFDTLIKDLPQKYAYRDDLIRMTQNIASQLDKIQDMIIDLVRGKSQ